MGAELVIHIYSCLVFWRFVSVITGRPAFLFFFKCWLNTSAAIIVTVIVFRVFYATLGILDVKTSRVKMFRSKFG